MHVARLNGKMGLELLTVVSCLDPHSLSVCCYHCLSCCRGLISEIRERPSMNLDDIRLVASTFKEYQIRRICRCNLGEPFTAGNIHEQLGIIRAANPDTEIIIGTRCGLFILNQGEVSSE